MSFKAPLKERLRRQRYLAELRRRGLCVCCLQPNEPGRQTHRCVDCTRRAYVRLRIKRCQHLIVQYQQELKHRLAENHAFVVNRRRSRRLDRAA